MVRFSRVEGNTSKIGSLKIKKEEQPPNITGW